MLYTCVRRFDVMDTVQKILGTKHGLTGSWDSWLHGGRGNAAPMFLVKLYFSPFLDQAQRDLTQSHIYSLARSSQYQTYHPTQKSYHIKARFGPHKAIPMKGFLALFFFQVSFQLSFIIFNIFSGESDKSRM